MMKVKHWNIRLVLPWMVIATLFLTLACVVENGAGSVVSSEEESGSVSGREKEGDSGAVTSPGPSGAVQSGGTEMAPPAGGTGSQGTEVALPAGGTGSQGPEEGERAALTAFFEATGGDEWTIDANWGGDLPLSQWHGVTTDDAGRVVALDLAENNLRGVIPPEFANLTGLILLDLGGNQLSGCLPASMQAQLNTAESDVTGLYFCCGGSETDAESEPALQPAQTSVETDREALIALFEATDGVTWDSSGLWAGSRPLSDWPGVTVDRDLLTSALSRYWEMAYVYEWQLPAKHEAWLVEAFEVMKVLLPPELYQAALRRELPPEYYESAATIDGTPELPTELGSVLKGRVVGLGLYDLGLKGDLPPELGNLVHLQTLDLRENQLTGEIPSQLGKLSNLRVLFLGENELSGEVPSALGNLHNLTELDISSNRLCGEIPAELGGLEELTHLDLENNRFSGEIPPALGNLENLRSLDFSDNALSGQVPPELGNIGSEAFWYDSRYDEKIPSIHPSLDLSRNQLAGEIPEALDRLWGYLDLSGNQFSGCVSDFLRDLVLSLSYSDDHTSELPVCDASDPEDQATLIAIYNAAGAPGWEGWLGREPIGEWAGVSTDREGRVIAINKISSNDRRKRIGFEGGLPSEVGNLVNLIYLDLRSTGTGGEIPPELGKLVNLRVLYLASNRDLSGEIPREFSNLVNLRIPLDFGGTGVCLPDASNLTVEYAKLCREQHALRAIQQQTSDIRWVKLDEKGRVIELHIRRGGGSLPPELWTLVNLETLNASQVAWIGEIPPEVGNLVNLETLNLDRNHLSGEIPPELGNLVNLKRLNLGANQLSGEIPPELGNLVNLKTLNLGANQLSGEIPPELGNLVNLETLELGANHLSGEIPPELSNLPNLETAHLDGNVGLEVPPELANLN